MSELLDGSRSPDAAPDGSLSGRPERLAHVLDRIEEGLIVCDTEWKYTYVNAAAAELLGYPAEQLLGRVVWEVFPESVGTASHAAHLEAMATGRPVTVTSFDPARGRWYENRIFPSPRGVATLFRDDTERREQERALGASEARYRALVEATTSGVWGRSADGPTTSGQEWWGALTGQTVDEMTGADGWGWLDAVHPDDREPARAHWSDAIARGAPFDIEYRVRDRDGGYHDIAVRGVPVHDGGSGGGEWIGTFTDVSPQRQVERALREREAVLRSFTDHTPVLMGLTELLERSRPDGSDDVLHVSDNPASERFFGVARGATAGWRATALGAPREVIDVWTKHYREALSSGAPVDFDYAFGEGADKRWLSVTVAPAGRGSHGARFAYVAQDITDRRRAEEARVASERLLRSVAANATLALFVMDERQQCVFMNAAAERLTGYRLEETLGRPLHDVIHHTYPDGRPYPLHECPIDQAFPANNREQGTEIFVHRDGSFYPVAFTASPLRDESTGEPVGTIIEVRGIRADLEVAEERERLLEAERALRYRLERLQRLTSALSEARTPEEVGRAALDGGLAAAGTDRGAVLLVEDGGEAMRIVAYAGHDETLMTAWPGKLSTEGLPAADAIATRRPVLVTTQQGYLARYPRAAEWSLATGHHGTALFPLIAGATTDGPVIGVLAFDFTRDVALSAQEVEYLAAIARLTATALERSLAYRAEQSARADAERQRMQALTANRAKTDFLANMSHELRTPLNAISGYVQLLEMELHGPVTDAQRDALTRMNRAQRHLIALVNDVLNLARLESGNVEYEVGPLDIAAVMAHAAQLVEPQMQARGVDFRVEVPPAPTWVMGDVDKVSQILLNLLANAAKFTNEGGEVMMSAEAHASSPGVVHVRVHDTGIGIPREKQESVFEPFVQVHRTLTRPTEGVGLGLSISRNLARGMGGELRVRSEVGVGSTFTLTLPATNPHHP